MSLVLVSPVPFTATLPAFATSPVNSVASVGGTLQFTAFAWDGIAYLNKPFGFPIQPQPTWTWTSSNTGVATISSTGLATGVSQGICTITASATVGGQIIAGSAQFGVALITPNTATVSYGSNQVFTLSSAAAGQGQWAGGSNVYAIYTGDTNLFGSTATAIPALGGNRYSTSTASMSILCWVGGYGAGGIQGVTAVATLNVTSNPT